MERLILRMLESIERNVQIKYSHVKMFVGNSFLVRNTFVKTNAMKVHVLFVKIKSFNLVDAKKHQEKCFAIKSSIQNKF